MSINGVSNIEIWASDTHSILDAGGQLINHGSSIEMGSHVWLSYNTTILKNTKISDNSLVGWGSIVTKKFHEKNSMIGGSPAILLKKNIRWDRKPLSFYNKLPDSSV